MNNFLNKILNNKKDLDYYNSASFNVERAIYKESESKLIVYTSSNDTIRDEDLSFIEKKLASLLKDLDVKIQNRIIKDNVDEAPQIEEFSTLTDDEVETINSNLIEEDQNYINNHHDLMEKEREHESSNSKKPEIKKTYFKPKTNKFSDVMNIADLEEEDTFPTVQGEVFGISKQETRTDGLSIAKFYIFDDSETICVKCFLRDEQNEAFDNDVKNGVILKLNGEYKYDKFDHQMAIIMRNYQVMPKPVMIDDSENKRVEIHAHTKMSLLEGSIEPEDLINIYKSMGHRGIFVTDVGCVQAYPNIMDMGDDNFKIGYGMEANVFDDRETFVQENKNGFKDYVVFDIETTGLNPFDCEIIEIGAVKVRDGEIVDRYNQLFKPINPIPKFISELTSITEEMVENEPNFKDAKDDFYNFIKGTVLVAHNANFDVGFIKNKFKEFGIFIDNPFADTMKMAREILPGLKNYKLDTLTDRLQIKLVSHHRAVDDAEATAHLFIRLVNILIDKKEIKKFEDFENVIYHDTRNNFRALIYAKNHVGLKNLYLIVSKSCIENFNKVPRVSFSDLEEHKEELIVGSEAIKGDIFSYFSSGFLEEDLIKKLEKYDFCEIQPLDHYAGLVGNRFTDLSKLSNILKMYVKALEDLNIKIIVGGNVFEKTKKDTIYRRILGKSRGDFRADQNPPLYIKTTKEILDGINYVDYDKKFEYAITNTNWLLDEVETMRAIPREKFPPIIEGSEDELRNTCYSNAKKIYGVPLPDIVKNRLDKELHSIIGNGYSVMYIIAKKLVAKSNSDGYLVGSRGSVGSSFAATMSDITEVNPLPPHYVCPNCKYSEFFTHGEYDIGIDMPEKDCPKCGTHLRKDGFTIPFETFLGFNGDKEPDIDLNFAGEYQPVAHAFVEELFGHGYVFRAGTLATIQEKVGYGYVKNYFEERGKEVSQAEINRLINGIVGIKRTTGQHPGGIMIVPKNKDIHDFSPIQYPADDPSNGVYTTHFAYKALHSNILKLDILGHDGPTMMRMLEDFTGVKSTDINLNDEKVLKMFTSVEPIGLTKEELGTEVATYGIPEFGTDFVRNMLVETKPKLFSDLVRISGLSHGTDVWTNNAQLLVQDGTCKIADVIATREDIMTYLLNAGLPNDFSFFTMEKVRKGKKLKPEDEEKMREHGLPEWYIESCNKIQYMFPKAHAAAYVMLSFRMAWYKLYYPKAFYATFFTTKKSDFDYETAAAGLDAVEKKMDEMKLYEKMTKKDQDSLKILEIVREMYLRGFKCDECDIYNSDATKFKVTDDGILPPLSTIPNLGDSVAINIVSERDKSKFISIEDLQKRTKLNKTCISFMQEHNLLNGLQDTNQISFF